MKTRRLPSAFAAIILLLCASSASAQVVTQTVTLTYEGLGVANGAPIPSPYLNGTAMARATVSHIGMDSTKTEMVVAGIDGEDVTFQGAGFGDLRNVAVGPTVTPSAYGYSDPAFGLITIIPTDTNSYIRLISFKIATKHDGAGNEADVKFYVNKIAADGSFISFVGATSEAVVAGDVDNNMHTLHSFGGTPITGAPSQGFEFLWETRNGRVAIDDFTFQVVTPSSTKLIVTLPGETFTSGSRNTGTPDPVTAGEPFNLTLTAVNDSMVKDTKYNGTKTISYSGPGGSPAYTTSVMFVAGQATAVSTTLNRAETTTISATDSVLTSGPSSILTVGAGKVSQLQVLAPGEMAAPGTASGKTGSRDSQSVGAAFNVTVKAVDKFFNPVTSAPADNIHITTSDPADTEPPDNTLASGSRTFSITPATGGALTVTAENTDNAGITNGASSNIAVAVGAIIVDYEGLGLSDGAPIPNPYSGISAPTVTVTHHAVTNSVYYQGVFFRGGVGPGNGYGNLTNVAVGPNDMDAYAGISIAPNDPNNFVRLISFDIATKDDGGGDLSFNVYIQDEDDNICANPFVTALGDADPNTHTHVDFGGTPIDGMTNKTLSIFWPASNGRVAIDNVQFEIIGSPALPRRRR